MLFIQNLNPHFLTTQIFCCFFLTGLIWVIQLVHYPSFSFIDSSQFEAFTKFHGIQISKIVMPLMILEFLTACLLFYGRNDFSEFSTGLVINFLGVVLIWISTFFLSVPIHEKLIQNFDLEQVRLLVLTNWPRTILWSLRSMFFIYIFK